jgi:hypothetical protein
MRKRVLRWLLFLFGLALAGSGLILWLSAPADRINAWGAAQIREGMTIEEVKAILRLQEGRSYDVDQSQQDREVIRRREMAHIDVLVELLSLDDGHAQTPATASARGEDARKIWFGAKGVIGVSFDDKGKVLCKAYAPIGAESLLDRIRRLFGF